MTYATKIGESVATTGTGPFALTQTAYGAFRTWRSGFANGDEVFYLATNSTGTIWEFGYGTFNIGSPDTLTRNLIASSSGALINWVTTPYGVFNTPAAEAMKHNLAPLVDGVANVPGWLPPGALWIDTSAGLVAAWTKYRYISGTRTDAASHAEEGRFHLGLDGGDTHLFAASQRRKVEDKGAASYAFDAADIGKVLAFNCAAAVRTLTMPAHDAAGMGHGAYVFVYPYGSTVNGVTFTPGGSDATDLATAPPGRVTRFDWDGARSKWVADHSATPPVLRGYLSGLTLSAAGGTATFGIAAGIAADSTNVDMMVLASAYTKTGSTWAVGSGNGGIDTGAITTGTWYHVWLIKRPDTGVVDILFSLSATAPTMPANYTMKRRIGSMKTDGSSQWVKFSQDGDEFLWDAPVLDMNGTTPPTSAASRTLTVPTGVVVSALIGGVALGDAGGNAVLFTSLAVADTTPANPGVCDFFCINTAWAAWRKTVRTNTSAQIRERSNSTTSLVVNGSTMGWIDRRGRDA